MSYTNNVPQATQTIAFTQPLIFNNFSYIDTAMKINHTWNGNAIGSEAPGSHQEVSFPNQGSDISSLPTGIASVLYSIAGNLFSYNGAKNPVSGVSGSGTITLTTSFQTIFTVPPNCIGAVTFSDINVVVGTGTFWLFASNPVGPPPDHAAWVVPSVGIGSPAIPLFSQFSGLNFQTRRQNSGTSTQFYKFIYWPI